MKSGMAREDIRLISDASHLQHHVSSMRRNSKGVLEKADVQRSNAENRTTDVQQIISAWMAIMCHPT